MKTLDLADGIYALPTGTLPSLVVCLEMANRPPARKVAAPAGVTLRRVAAPALEWYRELFRAVGEPWLWISRLTLDDAALGAILHDPLVEVYAVERDGRAEGLVELDRRAAGEVELAFFGVTARLIGHGVGRWLMEQAIARAFERPIARFWVHTCNYDHPAALAFYRRSGFVAYRFALDIGPDPRLTGALPPEAGPQAPLIP